jgi:tetratricopeptide (TPR) repeat protein
VTVQIDFYIYNVHEVVLWEPIWRALRARAVDAQFIVEPPGVCIAVGSRPDKSRGYRDIKNQNIEPLMTPEAHARILATLAGLGCPYELQGRYGADAAVTTQHVGWLGRYKGLKFRTMYGVGATKDSYGHGAVNVGMDAIFVHGVRSHQQIAAHVPSSHIVISGFPKYAAYLRGEFPTEEWRARFGCDPVKKTLAYVPTWAHNSSLDRFPAAIAALSERYNVLFKPHHNNIHFESERLDPLANAAGVKRLADVTSIVPYLACADLVLADVRSGSFTEAFLLDRPTVGLSPAGDRDADNLIDEAYLAAHVCADAGELAVMVDEALTADPYRDGRQRLAGQLFTRFDGRDDIVTAEAMIAVLARRTAPGLLRTEVADWSADDGGLAQLVGHGERLYAQGEFPDAARLFLDVLQLDPTQSDAWNNLGVTLFAMGELEQAGTALHRAMEVGPADPNPLTNLAQVLLQQNRNDEARPLLRRALQLAPSNIQALDLLARMDGAAVG